jgi:hypothetical protein
MFYFLRLPTFGRRSAGQKAVIESQLVALFCVTREEKQERTKPTTVKRKRAKTRHLSTSFSFEQRQTLVRKHKQEEEEEHKSQQRTKQTNTELI